NTFPCKQPFNLSVRSEMPHHRFEKNVPGPFYTTGECLSCGTPEAMVPDLLAPLTDENGDTYFVRQPSTPEEVERACQAVRCAARMHFGTKERTQKSSGD
ncbi:MAG: hypothetical protein V4772_20980, partial [Pseudomonadota bacterium]